MGNVGTEKSRISACDMDNTERKQFAIPFTTLSTECLLEEHVLPCLLIQSPAFQYYSLVLLCFKLDYFKLQFIPPLTLAGTKGACSLNETLKSKL